MMILSGCLFPFFWLAVAALVFVSFWKIFEKAGRQGWEGIVPYYNLYLLTEILALPILWFVLAIIPCTAIVGWVMISLALAKAFGKDQAFAIGLILLPYVFLPILAFSDAKFTRPTPPAAPPAVPPAK